MENVFSVFFAIGGSIGLGLYFCLVLPTLITYKKMNK